MTIKVCFVNPKSYPVFRPEVREHFGGAEVDLYVLAAELARDSRFEVSFVVADYGQPDGETIENVRIHKSLSFRQNTMIGAYKVYQALKRADADIYFNECFSPGVALIAWFCRRRGRRFIYRTASSRECDGQDIRDYPWVGRSFVWALRQAQTLITQNQTDAGNLKKTLGLDSQIIANGLRLPELADRPREIILWVGRSDPVKRADRFVTLAREFPQEKFVLICQRATGDERFEQLRRQVQTQPNCELIDYVPFNEVQAYFQRAKVVVNTSDTEGFPNVFVQAAAAGTPIVSLTVNPDGYLDRFDCGRCAQGDWPRLVSLLNEVLNPAVGQPLGAHGRRYVEHHHDIHRIIESYKTLFLERA